MKKVAILSIATVLMAGVAVAGENVKVKEKTTHSTTVQENVDQTGTQRDENTTVEKKQQTTTSDDRDGNTTTRKKVKVEKKHSRTTTDGSDGNTPDSAQEYHHQSETHHSTKEVEKK
jgi:hypothetical protein